MINGIAVVEWNPGDGNTRNFDQALRNLGYRTLLYHPGTPIPLKCDIILSFGPYGNILSILDKLNECPREYRPKFIHWDIEGMPDLRTPRFVLYPFGALRSWIGQMQDSRNDYVRKIMQIYPFRFIGNKFGRFKNFGDYQRANRQDAFDLFIVSSTIYMDYYQKHGIEAKRVSWGTSKTDYSEMNLERDIDVLWMGQRHGRRRTHLVDQIHKALEQKGFNMLVIDGLEHPYIYGEERTTILNRTKITLNLLPYWDFINFNYRFHLAAGNRCLVVSEDFLPHFPEYKAGFHYVQVPIEQLVETVIYYIHNQIKRDEIAENAFELATKSLTMENSMRMILQYTD
jgi:hypothetical protein